MLRIRIEDEGPIAAFRWRGVPGEDAGLARLQGVAERRGSLSSGGARCWRCGCPCRSERGSRCATWWWRAGRVALFGGSEVTASDALGALVADGGLGSAVRVGVRSEEGPRDIVMRSGLLADGAGGFARVLEGLLRAAR
jgi:trehalose 6-phosphate phosphatase